MAKNETESAKVTDIDSLTVSAAVLGQIFGVSDRRIRQMAEEGIIVRVAKASFEAFWIMECIETMVYFTKAPSQA